MKKDKIFTVVLIMGLVVFGVILYLKNTTPLNDGIYNKTWYRYDSKTGFYISLMFDDNSISINGNDEFSNCLKYSYNEKTKIFHLDCDKEVEYVSFNDDELVFEYSENDVHFFTNAEESFNYEFYKNFGMSEGEFIEQNSQVIDLRNVSFNSLVSLFKISKGIVIFYGNRCENMECYVFNKTLEKLIVKSSNIYTFDSSEMSNGQVNSLYKLNNDFGNDINFYNAGYPSVIVYENGKIVEKYFVKCDGFDCSKYESMLDYVE